MISRDWVKTLYMMLILPDETTLIREIFIAGFILWLVNIHRYTRILPMLSAPSGTGRNCHSLSDYVMIAKPFHATRPFIRIEILLQERQVFSSNLTISNYNFEFVPRPLFVAGAEKYEDACRHIGKNSRRWTRRTGINCFFPVYVFLKRFTLITSHLQGIDFMMQRDDFAAERPEWLSVFSFIMQRNDRNDSQNLPSETKQVSVLLGPYWFVVDH